MESIKIMLVGIAILLVVIIFHLFITAPLITDFLAILGILFVISGYRFKEK